MLTRCPTVLPTPHYGVRMTVAAILPIASALVTLAITLFFTGRREERRYQRERADKDLAYQRQRAERLAERRIEQFFEISAHLREWGTLVNAGDALENYDKLEELDARGSVLSSRIRILAPDAVKELWPFWSMYCDSLMNNLRLQMHDIEGTDSDRITESEFEIIRVAWEYLTKLEAAMRAEIESYFLK